MKWLGEQGADAPAALAGAVGISVPFDLGACARTMDRRPQRLLYTGSFMRSLRQKVTAKARVYPGFVDLDAVRRARTFAAYDRAVTAPLHGFADEEDYWRRASSLPYLTRVRRPTLLLSAVDDPFIPGWSLPDPAHAAAGGARGVRAARRPRGLRRGAAVARDRRGPSGGRWISWPPFSTLRPSASMTGMPNDAYGLARHDLARRDWPPTIARCAPCSAGRRTPSTSSARRRRSIPVSRSPTPAPAVCLFLEERFARDQGGRRRGAGRGGRPDGAGAQPRGGADAVDVRARGRRGDGDARAPGDIPARRDGGAAPLLHLLLAGPLPRDARDEPGDAAALSRRVLHARAARLRPRGGRPLRGGRAGRGGGAEPEPARRVGRARARPQPLRVGRFRRRASRASRRRSIRAAA